MAMIKIIIWIQYPDHTYLVVLFESFNVNGVTAALYTLSLINMEDSQIFGIYWGCDRNSKPTFLLYLSTFALFVHFRTHTFSCLDIITLFKPDKSNSICTVFHNMHFICTVQMMITRGKPSTPITSEASMSSLSQNNLHIYTATVQSWSDLSAELKCVVLHLFLVIFLKLFILGHSEMVLPVTNLPCRTTENQSGISAKSRDFVSYHAHLVFYQITFSHERRNLEIHNMECWIVGHVVLFHVVKLHSIHDLILLLGRRRQTKKGAEFVYFPSSVLQAQRSDIIIVLQPAGGEP